MLDTATNPVSSLRRRGIVQRIQTDVAIWLCLLSACLAVQHAVSLGILADDPCHVAEAEAKFAAFRPYLTGIDVVGYLASRHSAPSYRDEMEYSEARYTL